MAQVRQEFTFDDKGILDGLKKMHELAQQANKEFVQVNANAAEMAKTLTKSMDDSNKAIEQAVDLIEKKVEVTQTEIDINKKKREEEKKQRKEEKDAANERNKEASVYDKLISQIADKVNIAGQNLGKLIQKSKEFTKELRASIKESKTYQAVTDRLNKAYERSAKFIGDKVARVVQYRTEIIKTITESKAYVVVIQAMEKAYNSTIVALGNKIKATRAYSIALAASNAAIKGVNAALSLMRVALIATGIGAFIVALGSLVAYFTRTQKGVDQMNRVLKGLGAVVDGLIDRFAKFGSGVWKLFTGQWKEAVEEFKGAFNGAISEIRDNFQEGFGVEKARQELEATYQRINKQRAEDRARIKELNKIAEDTTKSLSVRADAARKAIQLEQQGLDKLIAAKEKELDLQRRENEISDTFRKDKQKEIDIETEIAGLREQSLELQTTLQNKLNTINQQAAAIRDKEIAQAKALREAYFDLVEEIEKKLEAQNLELLSGRERLAEERRIALAEIDLLEQRAKAAAAAAGQEYTLANQFMQIRENINTVFKEQAQELAKVETQVNRLNSAIDSGVDALYSKLGRQITPFGVDPGQAQEAGEIALENIAKGMRKAAKESASLLDEIKITMMSWLGLDSEQMALIEQSARTTFEFLGNMYTDSINRQIDENQRLLDSLQERESIIKEQLEREIALQEEGRANNVEGKRKELEAIQKEEEAAQRKAEQLRRRAQAAQLAANAAQQISNLITSATEILKAHAGIPLAGLAVAALGISTMYSLFSQARAQATSVTRAYKGGPMEDYLGGKRRSGFVNRGGQSDKPGRGDGYRVEGTNLVIGADEFMMNEDESRRHSKFLTAMNKGAFRNVDLNSLVDNDPLPLPSMSRYNRLTSIRRATIDRAERSHRDSVIVKAINQNFSDLISLYKRRKDRMALADYEGGYVEFDDFGNKKIVKK